MSVSTEQAVTATMAVLHKMDLNYTVFKRQNFDPVQESDK